MFRDESSHVIKKARAEAKRKGQQPGDPGSSALDVESGSSATPEPQGRLLSLVTRSGQSPCNSPVALTWIQEDENLLPTPDSASWPATPRVATTYTLNPTFQERGTAYFFSRYVTVVENGCHQRFDFVYDVWKPHSLAPERPTDGVSASMTAVGLVGLGNMTRSSEIMEAARKSYGTALRLTNLALRSPNEATKDTTMLSVLILSLFEMLAGSNPKTMKAWQGHVNGAIALANVRGDNQFQTPGGAKMFLTLCQKVIISCIQMEAPMPEPLIKMRDKLGAALGITDAAWQLALPTYKVLQTRYDLKHGELTDPAATLDRLCEIDDEFEGLLALLSKPWQYRVVAVTKPHRSIFRGLCHLYSDTSYASSWNGIRNCRLLVLETIISEFQKAFSGIEPELIPQRHLEQFWRARHKLERICEAILASVPQLIGLLNPLDRHEDSLTPIVTPISSVIIRRTPSPPTSPSSQSSSSSGGEKERLDTGPTLCFPVQCEDLEEQSKRFMLLASVTSSIAWPLYLVGMSTACSEEMRAYIVERLRDAAAQTGQMQAEIIAELVATRKPSSTARPDISTYTEPADSGDKDHHPTSEGQHKPVLL